MWGVYGLSSFFESTYNREADIFALLTCSLVLLAAAGNLVNNIYDIDLDLLDPRSNNPIEHESISLAWRWYHMLNIAGIGLGLGVSYHYDDWNLAGLTLAISLSLWLYSKILQKLPLVGNILIAVLCALPPIYSIIQMDNELMMFSESQAHDFWSSISMNLGSALIWSCALYFSIFAFLITLSREIVKDIEDMHVDAQLNYRTAPVVFGFKASRILALIPMILCFVFSLYSTTVVIEDISFQGIIIGAGSPAVLIAIGLFKMSGAEDAASLSRWLKIYLLFGLGISAIFWLL